MEPGISSYTYTWAIGVPGKMPENPMTIFQLIDKAVDLGVQVVQVADNLPLDRFSESELMTIRNHADKSGVKIEVGSKKMTIENIERYIEIAVLFNSPILRFVIDGEDFYPDLAEIHQILQKVIPKLERNKVFLAIENHDRFRAHEFAEMVEKAESDNVAICLDTVNSMGAGEGFETVTGRLAHLAVNLHVKEFTVKRVFHKMGFVIEGCPLGQGMLQVPELVVLVSDRCKSAILEQWTPPEQTIDATIEKEAAWAVQSTAYLKSILNKNH